MELRACFPRKFFRFTGSESLILLCQFESICLSCFRIVIDFLLFSLIFFFFQCFSITTLNVIIRSAFDLFCLPYYMTFSHGYFILVAQIWFLRNFCTLNDLNFALLTSSAAMPRGKINDTAEGIYKNRNNKEVFVTMAQELSLRNTVLEYEPLADWSIL